MPTVSDDDRFRIFNAPVLTELAVAWKHLVKDGKHDEARDVMEQIIIGSTSMFERLAQHEGFTNTVDLDTLVQSCREKVVRWLISWDPLQRPLFTFFSVCARHAFLGEVNKINQYRSRFHATSDSLEKFFGKDDHSTFKHDAAGDAKAKLHSITIRWGDAQSAGAIGYAIDCLVEEDPPSKDEVIRGMCYGFGLNETMGKFFYGWALFAMRDALYEKIHIPFTQQDVLRLESAHTHIPDLLSIITWEQFKRIVATLGGQRLKIPTMQQLGRLHQDYLMCQEATRKGGDPAVVEEVAKKHGRPQSRASELYEQRMREFAPERDHETELHPD